MIEILIILGVHNCLYADARVAVFKGRPWISLSRFVRAVSGD